jgi:hypothetical protein
LQKLAAKFKKREGEKMVVGAKPTMIMIHTPHHHEEGSEIFPTSS